MSEVETATHEERRMPFIDHLAELRDRLRNSVIAIFLATVVCYIFRGYLFRVMAKPLIVAFEKAHAAGIAPQLVFLSPIEAFLVLLKTAIVGAIFASSPVIFLQLWGFISPGLYAHERRWAAPFVITAVLLFIGGATFCYHFVLPPGYEFFLTAAQDATHQLQAAFPVAIKDAAGIRPMISMDEYFGLTLMLLLVFGAVFELPLILSVLAILGVVSAASLWRFNRYAILLFAIAGAILTPGDLVIGQLAMAGSLTVLYNLSIGIAWLVERKRTKGDAEADDAAEGHEESTALVPRE